MGWGRGGGRVEGLTWRSVEVGSQSAGATTQSGWLLGCHVLHMRCRLGMEGARSARPGGCRVGAASTVVQQVGLGPWERPGRGS